MKKYQQIKAYKKYLLFLGILVVLSPLGILLPELFQAGDAWGEWSTETVKEQTGTLPAGMKKDAALYQAPIPDYNLGKEKGVLRSPSASYLVSGLVGTGIILVLTLGSIKLIARKPTE
ncbi:MAG: PDGLE domain-containing protein [Prolixibacteraceae bacterium]